MAGGAQELVQMPPEELEVRLEESRKELFNLRFQLATGQLDNTARVSQVRREVARILTVLREQEILEAEALLAADQLEVEPTFAPAARQARRRRAEKVEAEEEVQAVDTEEPGDEVTSADEDDEKEEP